MSLMPQIRFVLQFFFFLIVITAQQSSPPIMSNNNTIPPLGTRAICIYFTTTTVVDPVATSTSTSTSLSVNDVALNAILATVAAYTVPANNPRLEFLGAFIANFIAPGKSTSSDALTDTQFKLMFSNLGVSSVDVTNALDQFTRLDWRDQNNNPLAANAYVDTANYGQDQMMVLLNFRTNLPNYDLLARSTLLMLNRTFPGNAGMNEFLADLQATDQGDETRPGVEDPSTNWARGIIERITTGGPNGSMAGDIAINFLDAIAAPSTKYNTKSKNLGEFDASDPNDPFTALLQSAVDSAAESTAQGLADLLNKQQGAGRATEPSKIATIVKGIKDSMPSTGKTLAQLAVFNALNSDYLAALPRPAQLRLAFTIGNAIRTTVEATGNHIANLYQDDQIPIDEELEAVGSRSLKSFLKSVGKTVAKGVMQAAPVVLSIVLNSTVANNNLGSTLPPEVMLASDSLRDLCVSSKIILASRIVNGVPNPASVVTDKAVSDLSDRTSNLGAQATLETFGTIRNPEDPPTRQQFRDVALAIAELSPTFANVTDIGATNLVTDTNLKHADSLRQQALEVGIRSCANMIAENPAAEILYKVHLHRLKNGTEAKPRSFGSFLKAVVPISTEIAKAAMPAVLSVL